MRALIFSSVTIVILSPKPPIKSGRSVISRSRSSKAITRNGKRGRNGKQLRRKRKKKRKEAGKRRRKRRRKRVPLQSRPHRQRQNPQNKSYPTLLSTRNIRKNCRNNSEYSSNWKRRSPSFRRIKRLHRNRWHIRMCMPIGRNSRKLRRIIKTLQRN